MAASLAQNGFDALNKPVQLIVGNKGLYGACESAAVYAVCAAAFEQRIAQRQRNGHRLKIGFAGGTDVLKIHPGAVSGFGDEAEEGFEIAAAEGGGLFKNAAVFLINMDGAENGAVGDFSAQVRQRFKEVLLGHLAEGSFSEILADGLQLLRDGTVFFGQPGVVRAAFDDAQSVIGGSEGEGETFDMRNLGILKVDEDHAAHRGGHLIHQTAGLSEILVFRVLGDLSDFDGGEVTVAEQFVDDCSHQHFERCGRAQAAAGQDGRVDVRGKA